MKCTFSFVFILLLVSSCQGVEVATSRHAVIFNEQANYSSSYGMQPFGTILLRNEVKENEFLSDVFDKNGIDQSVVYQVSQLPDSLFDARKFRVGNRYAFLYDMQNEEVKPVKFFYEKNKVDYAIINLTKDSIGINLAKKTIDTVDRITTGLITSSLYQTLEDQGANSFLAVELSEIYAWTIDFYRIQKEDNFKIIYEEEFVEGESLGEFKIKACVFNHFNNDNFAFFFDNPLDTAKHGKQYYDGEGNSLKNAFLKAPVKYSRISSKYTMNRYHPVTGQHKPHLGTDYAAPAGTPIYSTADGVILEARFKRYNGNYVKVKHSSVYTTQYLHMSKIADNIRPGVFVEQGEVIGYVGQTGLATGPHVCYRFWKNGMQVDPYAQDLPSSEPLDSALMEEYLDFIAPLKVDLEELEIIEATQNQETNLL